MLLQVFFSPNPAACALLAPGCVGPHGPDAAQSSDGPEGHFHSTLPQPLSPYFMHTLCQSTQLSLILV